MEKITGRRDGINWVWYYELELEGNVCKLVRSYRLHKFDDFQGADKHPRDAVNVRFADESGCSGYGRLNTHITLEIGKGYTYPMYDDLTLMADKLAAMRITSKMQNGYGKTVAQQVMQDIRTAEKFVGSFGAMSKGTIY